MLYYFWKIISDDTNIKMHFTSKFGVLLVFAGCILHWSSSEHYFSMLKSIYIIKNSILHVLPKFQKIIFIATRIILHYAICFFCAYRILISSTWNTPPPCRWHNPVLTSCTSFSYPQILNSRPAFCNTFCSTCHSYQDWHDGRYTFLYASWYRICIGPLVQQASSYQRALRH